MMQNTEKEVDRFISHFQNQLEQISKLNTSSKELYKKLLYVSAIDAVSRSVYPRRGNRDRFVSFIKRFSNWSNGNRISMTHLFELLQRNPDTAFDKLRTWVFQELKTWSVHASSLSKLEIDPTYEEVKKQWPNTKEHRTPIEGVALESLQHYQLLYSYRNSLVHELRIPGYGMEFDEDLEPFYHKVSDVNENNKIITKSIELVYPSGFFNNLLKESLENYSIYMKANNLNPYDYYSFGTYWINELNH